MFKFSETGYLYFHQGWADIINQLALINYYSNLYERLILLIRDDSKEMIDFYVKKINNVDVIYIKKDQNLPNHIVNNNIDNKLLFHGFHDSYRNDNYKNKFSQNITEEFWKNFYIVYDIDYNDRIKMFNIDRNYGLEQIKYDEFIKEYGDNYILLHEDVLSPIKREISIEKNNIDINYVSLTNKTNVFFDYIKVIENAKEIIMVDSVWAALIYQIDAKYGLFKHIPITVNCIRNHHTMFSDPIKLTNWKII